MHSPYQFILPKPVYVIFFKYFFVFSCRSAPSKVGCDDSNIQHHHHPTPPPLHPNHPLQRDHREPADQLHLRLVWELQGLSLAVSAESGEDSGEHHRDPAPHHPGHSICFALFILLFTFCLFSIALIII